MVQRSSLGEARGRERLLFKPPIAVERFLAERLAQKDIG
jgi:hypothetical protein